MSVRLITPTPSLPYRLRVLRMLSNARRVGDRAHTAQLTAELAAIDREGEVYRERQRAKGQRSR